LTLTSAESTAEKAERMKAKTTHILQHQQDLFFVRFLNCRALTFFLNEVSQHKEFFA